MQLKLDSYSTSLNVRIIALKEKYIFQTVHSGKEREINGTFKDSTLLELLNLRVKT